MKFIFTFFMTLMAFKSYAFNNYQNRTWFSRSSSPQSICSKLDTVYYKYGIECNAIIKNKKFQKEAIKVCSKNKIARDKMSCLKIIANVKFDNDALKKCDVHNNAQKVGNCLQVIKNATFDMREVERCRLDEIDRKTKYSSINKTFGVSNIINHAYIMNSCLRKARKDMRFADCKSVTKEYSKLFLEPTDKSETYYSLDFDVVKLMGHNSYISYNNKEYFKVKLISAYNIFRKLIDREFFIESKDVTFEDFCYR